MDRNKELKVHRLRLPGRSLCSIRSNRKWCKRRGSSLQCQNCFFVYPIIDCNLKNLCLQLQGLIFTVGTICVALIIGLPLGYALFSYAKHNGIFGMNIYHVPIVPIFIMIFLVGLLQIVLSLVLSSNLKKETLVERIRYQG